ncbi:sensor histidine kinase [Algicella marina]|uniref:histidine kinase n=1 Tax=Algicella marina TaxID=2683284 RepID=A0A6P1SXE0_9RHOB|nr:ATP-binding protein [Algicella marina]QHQ34205.1 PAS domain-containing protein [Algicella marina]
MSISADPTRSTADYRAMVESLPTAVLAIDADGRITTANRRMRQILSFCMPAGTWPGARIDTHFTSGRADLMADIRATASGGSLRLRHRQRPEISLDMRVSALKGPDGPATAYTLLENPEKPIDKTFEALNTQLRRANQLAAEQRRLIRQMETNIHDLERFSYVAAHDLKTPLNHIAGLIDIVEEDYGEALPPEATETLDIARTAAERLQKLIADLLEHARSGAMMPTKETICIEDAIARVEEAMLPQFRGTDARIDIMGHLGEAQADPVLLDQLLINIFGNAIKYRAESRSPLIRVRRLHGTNGNSRLTIRDNGIGFHCRDRTRLFEPFERLVVPEAVEGSGIGLATCRSICEKHQWHLTAGGIPGRGAIFQIAMPDG